MKSLYSYCQPRPKLPIPLRFACFPLLPLGRNARETEKCAKLKTVIFLFRFALEIRNTKDHGPKKELSSITEVCRVSYLLLLTPTPLLTEVIKRFACLKNLWTTFSRSKN
jgi:hypothetical protein